MVAKITAVLVSVALVFFLMLSGSVVEFLGAGELMVIQAPTSGQLRWSTQPGVYWQGFGKVTTYKKRFSYEFDTAKIVFNDGGGATLKGSVQVDMPSDEKNLNALHTRYGSQAYKDVQGMWADAFANLKTPIVPSVVMGASAGGNTSAQSFMDLLMSKTARDLALDLSPGRQN